MKLTDKLIDDYINGTLNAAARDDIERQLHGILEASAPEVPTKRMWNGIRAQLARESALAGPAESPLWVRLMNSFSSPRTRFGLAGLAAAFFVVIGIQVARTPTELPLMKEHESVAPAPAAAPAVAKAKVAAQPAEKKIEVSQVSELALVQPAASDPVKTGPSEVERALSDQDLDDVIATMLSQRQTASLGNAAASEDRSALSPLETVAYGASAPFSSSGGRSVNFSSKSAAPEREVARAAQPETQVRIDSNGFWNFRPAAMALNRRDWPTASRELQAAILQAPEPAERAFAYSTLSLLQQGGQPVVLPVETGAGLSIQSAQRWQVFVDNHVARYSGGVVARMPGLRSEGGELLLDMAFDRASFSPGTRFIKVADETATQVKSSQGETVDATEFRAVRGADYLLRANELRLK